MRPCRRRGATSCSRRPTGRGPRRIRGRGPAHPQRGGSGLSARSRGRLRLRPIIRLPSRSGARHRAATFSIVRDAVAPHLDRRLDGFEIATTGMRLPGAGVACSALMSLGWIYQVLPEFG